VDRALRWGSLDLRDEELLALLGALFERPDEDLDRLDEVSVASERMTSPSSESDQPSEDPLLEELRGERALSLPAFWERR